jgi:hypothetical protein
MSVRNGSIGGGKLGARGEAISKRASPISEYSAAVAVLNEDNMTKACALLLSEKDDGSNQEEEETDYQKLLKLFEQCQEASKIVEKRAPATIMPSLAEKQQQHQRGPPTAARAQAIALKPKVKTMVPPRRSVLATRTTAKKTGPPAHSFAPPLSLNLKRDTSNSSSASTSSVGSGRSAKKSRLSPPALTQDPDRGAMAPPPPPEAMSFLAALNSQGGKQRKPQRPEEKKTPTKSKELTPPATGSRRQPSRSSRRG